MTLQQAAERYADDLREATKRMGVDIAAWKAQLPDAA
jgi:hypothetical protein